MSANEQKCDEEIDDYQKWVESMLNNLDKQAHNIVMDWIRKKYPLNFGIL
jgi:hypothetical protein